MSSLPRELRNQLQRAVLDARSVAETGARKALEALAVHEADAYGHLSPEQRQLRRQLRAQARQLGDTEDTQRRGRYRITHLAEKVAYDHWHRLLFARFLAENHLLISPEHGVNVTFADCEELAPGLGLPNGWEVAARFAAVMLPEIFRADDPAGQVIFAPEDQAALRALVTGLPVAVFTARDALGWTYQFWQADRITSINETDVPRGADEIPAVTQLFTEDYMVDFLLDNTLGAWWAGKQMRNAECGLRNAATEADARQAVALPGCEWKYLRFVRSDVAAPAEAGGDALPRVHPPAKSAATSPAELSATSARLAALADAGEADPQVGPTSARAAAPAPPSPNADGGRAPAPPSPPSEGGEGRGEVGPSQLSTLNSQPRWTPAAGTFPGWPASAAALRALDPCMGSGHFVVAMFERLVALRMAEEKLDEKAAVAAVIRDNLFGLEIDPRCTQIAAFNLALAAWRRVGHCKLLSMNLACAGLAPNAREAEWMAMAGSDEKLQRGMERLYGFFRKAALLGSLINPRANDDDLLVASFHDLRPLLEKAMTRESKDAIAHEMAVTARGLTEAAEILASQFTLVATNVPYLKSGKQCEPLKEFCERVYPNSKYDLATCFVERCLAFCTPRGTVALVTPQNWLFQPSYKRVRKNLLQHAEWRFAVNLGEEAWQAFGDRGPKATLLAISEVEPRPESEAFQIDATTFKSFDGKSEACRSAPFGFFSQIMQLQNPDHRITTDTQTSGDLLARFADSYHGLTTGDLDRMCFAFWELREVGEPWITFQGTVSSAVFFGGASCLLRWGQGAGAITELLGSRLDGQSAWGRRGVAISQTRTLAASLYTQSAFDNNTAVLVPKDQLHLLALWTFCTDEAFAKSIRGIDPSVKVTNGTLVKIPFDLAHWQQVAAEKYPHGLPKPFSSDPTQWLFNGHPAIIHHRGTESTEKTKTEKEESASPCSVSSGPLWLKSSLHVAVARLLGYQWPRQTGSSFPDCPALAPDDLEKLADEDGIVCLSAIKGEEPAAERLRALLSHALGRHDLGALLASAGPKGSRAKTLEDWLRDEFFEQHCELFHQRPFIWHIWDGQRGGFAALVNYHRLTRANLEKLTFSYLGDWLTRQQAAVTAGEPGSDARLLAAQALQAELKLILAGEPPHDLFVRWKPLAQQPLGWDPDLNDGVRVNLRPFLLARDVGKKGAGLLRAKPGVKWDKDRGKEPQRDKRDFPWFWSWDEQTQDFKGGTTFDGNRWNACHYTTDAKRKAREGKR